MCMCMCVCVFYLDYHMSGVSIVPCWTVCRLLTGTVFVRQGDTKPPSVSQCGVLSFIHLGFSLSSPPTPQFAMFVKLKNPP